MPLKEPQWWYQDPPSIRSRLLWPLGLMYGSAAWLRYKLVRPYTPRVPVICVGNFTAGGTGKTPAAIAIAGLVRDLGREPVFLTRGYGGNLPGPIAVNLVTHSAPETGDEALLLARAHPTVVARNRKAGAQFIEQHFGNRAVIIMDDGLQNPSLAKSLSVALVSAGRGLGNAWVMPAGPLRAPFGFQRGLADAVLVNAVPGGRTHASTLLNLTGKFERPILYARAEPAMDTGKLKGARLAAFAGIANPERFFELLERLGASVVAKMPFPDHHVFSVEDAAALLAKSAEVNAALVTTEKDMARLYGAQNPTLQQLADVSVTLPIRLVFEDGDAARLLGLIGRAIQKRAP